MSDTERPNDLSYLSEAESHYTVRSGDGKIIDISKGERGTDTYPSSGGKFATHWLKLAFFGMPLGGILTILYAPLVFGKNIRLMRNNALTQRERIHSINYLIVSSILFLLGSLFFVLFFIHLLL